MASSMIMKSIYVLPADKECFELVSKVSELGTPGLNLIDMIPYSEFPFGKLAKSFICSGLDSHAVRCIPSWLPGAGMVRKAEEVGRRLQRMIDRPYDQLKAERVTSSTIPMLSPMTHTLQALGTNQDSLVSTLLTENEQNRTLDYKCELLIKQNAAQINLGM